MKLWSSCPRKAWSTWSVIEAQPWPGSASTPCTRSTACARRSSAWRPNGSAVTPPPRTSTAWPRCWPSLTSVPRPLTRSAVASLDVAFHDAVYQAAHHERLYQAWLGLRSQIFLYLVHRGALRADFADSWLTDHEEYLEVLMRRKRGLGCKGGRRPHRGHLSACTCRQPRRRGRSRWSLAVAFIVDNKLTLSPLRRGSDGRAGEGTYIWGPQASKQEWAPGPGPTRLCSARRSSSKSPPLCCTRLGASQETADLVATSLVLSNLVGHDSHGIVRLVQYSEMVRAGQIKPAGRPRVVSERGAVATGRRRLGVRPARGTTGHPDLRRAGLDERDGGRLDQLLQPHRPPR